MCTFDEHIMFYGILFKYRESFSYTQMQQFFTQIGEQDEVVLGIEISKVDVNKNDCDNSTQGTPELNYWNNRLGNLKM